MMLPDFPSLTKNTPIMDAMIAAAPSTNG